jgi:hypothetical protein
MGHKHAPAAVSYQCQSIKCIPFCVVGLQKIQISIPFVSDHLAAGEASHRDYHLLELPNLFLKAPQHKAKDWFTKSLARARDAERGANQESQGEFGKKRRKKN